MKLPEFNHHTKKWDRFKAFYTEDNGFYQFETGELIIDRGWRDARAQKHYHKYDVWVFKPYMMPRELKALRLFTPDNKPVLRSWLDQSTAMLYDPKHSRLVGLEGVFIDEPRHIPTHAQYMDVYYSNADTFPMAGHHIAVEFPRSKQLDLEEKRVIYDNIKRAKVLARLGVVPQRTTNWAFMRKQNYNDHIKWLSVPGFDLTTVDPELVTSIALYGIDFGTERQYLPYLKMLV